MTTQIDAAADLPIGEQVNSSPAKAPQRRTLEGRFVTLEALDPKVHGESLWTNLGGAQNAPVWVYVFDGPYLDRATFEIDLERKAASQDYLFFAIVDNETKCALGMAAYLNIHPAHRSIEVGSVLYSPALQRTRGATEAMYLMARHAFDDLGYRRYEWKCNALNEPSRRAAARFGFGFEGIFRQHLIIKGRNRDTAWFSMLDSEWPVRKAAFECWLHPSNFDAQGQQTLVLSELTGADRQDRAK